MPETELQKLEAKIDQLLERCAHLVSENKGFKQREAEWQRERTRLIEKNDLARTRVEAMIGRLKSLESEAQ